MNIRELIEELKKHPQDARITSFNGAGELKDVDVVYLSAGGNAIMCSVGESADSDELRPIGAPNGNDQLMFYPHKYLNQTDTEI